MKSLIVFSSFYIFLFIFLQVECKNATKSKETGSIFEGIDLITPKVVIENNFIDNHLNFNERNTTYSTYSEFIKNKYKSKASNKDIVFNQTYLYYKCKELVKEYPNVKNKTGKEVHKLFEGKRKIMLKLNESVAVPTIVERTIKTLESQLQHYSLQNSVDLKNFNFSIIIKNKRGLVKLNNDIYKFKVNAVL